MANSAKPDKDGFEQVTSGHLVSVEYTGTLDNGEEFDSSKGHGPIQFVAGSHQVIKGFDDAVVGMKLDESKKFRVAKEEAYGDINPELLHKIPLEKLPEDIRKDVKTGGFLVMQGPGGEQIPAKVTSISDEELTLDLNHPLAGKDLNFEIKVTKIEDGKNAVHHHDYNHEHKH